MVRDIEIDTRGRVGTLAGRMKLGTAGDDMECAPTLRLGAVERRPSLEHPLPLLIPILVCHDPRAQGRMPMDMILHGWSRRRFQASQQRSTIYS